MIKLRKPINDYAKKRIKIYHVIRYCKLDTIGHRLKNGCLYANFSLFLVTNYPFCTSVPMAYKDTHQIRNQEIEAQKWTWMDPPQKLHPRAFCPWDQTRTGHAKFSINEK